MRVTERGQITIPIELRRKYGISADAEVEVVDSAEGLRILVNLGKENAGRRMVRRMRGRGNFGMTTDEYMRLVRGSDDE